MLCFYKIPFPHSREGLFSLNRLKFDSSSTDPKTIAIPTHSKSPNEVPKTSTESTAASNGSNAVMTLAKEASMYFTLSRYARKATAVPKRMIAPVSSMLCAVTANPGAQKGWMNWNSTPPMNIPQPTTTGDPYFFRIRRGCRV